MACAATASADVVIEEFNRDKIVFDVGSAFGKNSAEVPVSGLADPGQVIEVRLWDEGASTGTEWVTIGTADSSGRWSGAVSSAASANWYNAEARVAGGSQVTRTQNTVGLGDVVGILGQSELAYMFFDFYGQGAVLDVPDPTKVQVTEFGTQSGPHTGDGPTTTFVSNDNPVTAQMAAVAAFWQANVPDGRPVHIVDLATGGMSRPDLADESTGNWDNLEAVVDHVRADGTDIGLIVESWHAADRGLDLSEGATPFYTGADENGVAFEQGAAPDGFASVDNFLWDVTGQGRGLFDVETTKLAEIGPHRYEVRDTDPLINGTTYASGEVAGEVVPIGVFRAQNEAWMSNPAMSQIAVQGVLPSPLDYENGRFVDGVWTDRSHPSPGDDGSARFAVEVMNGAMVALGLLDYVVPVFDLVTWTRDYVEVGSSAGPILTARVARGLEALDDTYAHWTDVLGFEVNGVAAERAELTEDGLIRIYPIDTALFSASDTLAYGTGGASGYMQPVDDFLAQGYLNIPIVDTGLIGLEGVAVVPTPNSSAFANTLSDTPLPVPLPGGLVLLGSAMGGMGLLARRRRRRA